MAGHLVSTSTVSDSNAGPVVGFYENGLGDSAANSNSTQKTHRINKFYITAGLIGLAVLLCAIFIFSRNAKGFGDSSTNGSNGNNAANEAPKSENPAADNQSADSSSGQSGTSNNSSVDIKLNSTSHSSSDPADNYSSSDLTVNGKHVPTNGGNVNHHYASPDGNTNVNISVQNNSSSGGSTP